MASGTLGSSRVKISNLNFYRARVGEAHQSTLRITWMVHKSQNHAGVRTSSRTSDLWRMYCTSSSGSQYGSEESKTSACTRRRPPDLSEVGSLITGICEASSVEKIEMKLNGFHLYLARNPTRKTATLPPSPQSLAPPVKADAAPEEPVASASLPETSLAVTKSIFSIRRWQITLTKAANEGLVVLQSPKVGFFKISRTIKGKHALPACKERQIVEEGQVVCYIDQLGGEMSIKADVSGEVIKILLEDGGILFLELAVVLPTPNSAEFPLSCYSFLSSYGSGWLRGCSHNHSSFTQNKDVAVDGFSGIFLTISNYVRRLIESLNYLDRISRCDIFICPLCTQLNA